MSRGILLRAAELEKARVFIVYIRSQIRYSSQKLEAIISEYLKEHEGNLPSFMSQDILSNEHGSVQNGILKALGQAGHRQGLKGSDLACLKSFFSSLGRGDVESQTALCELYEALINERLLSARQRAEKYGGLYTSLCVMGGLAISILLI